MRLPSVLLFIAVDGFRNFRSPEAQHVRCLYVVPMASETQKLWRLKMSSPGPAYPGDLLHGIEKFLDWKLKLNNDMGLLVLTGVLKFGFVQDHFDAHLCTKKELLKHPRKPSAGFLEKKSKHPFGCPQACLKHASGN